MIANSLPMIQPSMSLDRRLRRQFSFGNGFDLDFRGLGLSPGVLGAGEREPGDGDLGGCGQ
jgi:hypothetical protein